MFKTKNCATRQAHIALAGTIGGKFEASALLRLIDLAISNPRFPVLDSVDIISGLVFKCQ